MDLARTAADSFPSAFGHSRFSTPYDIVILNEKTKPPPSTILTICDTL